MPPMPLRESQKKHLRGLAHRLHPYVTVGDRGLTDTVVEELNTALEHHELIKIRVNEDDRETRRALIEDIVKRTESELVMSIGRTASLFRRNPTEPKINLPR